MPSQQSYIVAITRWGRPPEQEVEALAPLLKLSPKEARHHLTGQLPVIVSPAATTDGASGLRRMLRERGHGAVVCDRGSVLRCEDMLVPRDFELGPLVFAGMSPESGRGEIAYAEIVGIVWATHIGRTTATEKKTEKRLSAGRALMTGGLVMRKEVSDQKTGEEETREGVVYVLSSTGTGHQLLKEGALRYGGLGAKKAATKLLNFRATVDILRERAPKAFFDARLATKPARSTPLAAGLEGGVGTTLPSNVPATDLAVHLITIARLQGQI